MRVELNGSRSYEQKSMSLSPNDARGIDVKLDVGQQSETVTVTAQQEVIQTETGAREGVLNAKQIDNLSIIGRSALELLRILPGVVADFDMRLELGSGERYSELHGERDPRSTNTAQLDGSNLLDVGCNCGMMVSLNNDMVSEVKVQSSNFAAEYGSGAMNVSGVTKSGSSRFHGEAYDYIRDNKFAANDRSNTIAGVAKPEACSTIRAATSAVRSPSATATPRTKTSCSSSWA